MKYEIEEIFLSEISKVEFNSAIWKKVRTLDSFQLSSSLKVKTEISFAFSADDLLIRLMESEGINTK